jgi:hypothetical protein|tara:strand:- start:357 stop:581 length:225 start_codon:yes stop_codon:yes gene_type:complete
MANKTEEANLFTFQANLKQNGTIELIWEGVKPEQFESAMVEGLPQWDGSHATASLLRYLRSMGDEMMEKSRNYI